jgi:hypothetical protein
MSREPTDTVQINLRIKEAARARFAAEAERHNLSMNATILMLAERALRQPVMLEADRLAENVCRYLGPLGENMLKLQVRGEATRAADDLIALIRPLLAAGIIDGPAGAEMRKTIDKYVLAQNAIASEAREQLIKIGVTP